MPLSDPSVPPWLLSTIAPVLNESPDGIHILDHAGNLIYANPVFRRMLGYSPTAQVARHVSAWDAQWVAKTLPTPVVSLGTHEQPLLTRHQRQDGSSYDAAINVILITHAGQTYFFCTARDVTAQRQVAAAQQERDEQHRLLIADLKEVVFRTDATGRWLFLNPAWQELTGFTVAASLGQSFLDYVYPEDRQRNLDLFQPLMARTKATCRHEIRYCHHNGGFRWVEVWARLTLDADGNATGTAGTLTDITERQQVQAALHESEARFRTIFYEDCSVKLLIDPQTGRIADANQAALEFYGYPYAQLTQMHIQAINQLSPEAVMYEMQQAKMRRKNFFTFQHRLASGEIRDVEVYSSTLEVTHQTYLLSFIHDVTEGKRAEAALRTSEAQAQRQVQALEALSATLTAITAELEPERLLKLIVEHAATLLAADVVEIAVYDDLRGDLVLAARFPTMFTPTGYRQSLDAGIFGYVARTHQSLFLNDYLAWPDALVTPMTLGIIATLAVPLLQGDRLIGVLGVGMTRQGRTFTTDDERLLLLFAQQATVALINARLNAHLLIDPLTGFHNRRRFFELAEQALREAAAGGQPLGIAILDLDHFKHVNDTYGHRVGDDVLRGIAAQCMALLPPEAIVGRIGGEEFAIMLPDADAHTAVAALEVVRRHSAETPVPTRQGKLIVTMSIGVTTLALAGELLLDELLEQADQALYQAKADGRNRICLFATHASSHAEDLRAGVFVAAQRFRDEDRHA